MSTGLAFQCYECQAAPVMLPRPPAVCPSCGTDARESLRELGVVVRHPGIPVCGELEFPWMPAVVYYCIDKRDRELYIGFSTNLVVRLAQHAVRAPWWREIVKVTWVDFQTSAEARAYETAEIRRLNPIGNLVGRLPEGGIYTPPAAP